MPNENYFARLQPNTKTTNGNSVPQQVRWLKVQGHKDASNIQKLQHQSFRYTTNVCSSTFTAWMKQMESEIRKLY